MSRQASNEPYWEPLPRRRITPLEMTGIVVRHLIPVAGVLAFGWAAGQFLLLSVFNIAFSVVCIGMIGTAVSTRQAQVVAPGWGNQIRTWLTSLVVALLLSLLLTAMFGWVVALLFVSSGHSLYERSVILSALLMVASAAPVAYQQYQTDLRSGLTEQQRKKRDQPNVVVLMLTAGLIFILSGYAADFGRFGLIVMVIAVTGLFILRDLRPDLMRELARPSNMPPPKEYGEAGRNHDFLLFLWQRLKNASPVPSGKRKRSPKSTVRKPPAPKVADNQK